MCLQYGISAVFSPKFHLNRGNLWFPLNELNLFVLCRDFFRIFQYSAVQCKKMLKLHENCELLPLFVS